MSPLDIRATPLPDGAAAGIGALAERARGPVITAGEDRYDTERVGFQSATHAVPRRPARRDQ